MNVNGQITLDSQRGKIIQKIIQEYKPKNIVEIGTWKGEGSTLCILNSIDENTNFITIESNQTFFEIAKKNLKKYEKSFQFLLGKIIEIEDVDKFVEENELNEQQRGWLQEDIKNLSKNVNVLEKIPEHIDFLLLDGGEFSTYSEWCVLKNRTKIIALDDIQTMKCSKIHKELLIDNNYELMEKTNEGNGFSVYIKKI